MPCTITRLAATSLLLTISYAHGQAGAGVQASNSVESQYTSLMTKSCEEATDESDADGLTYLICPGVAGYHLQVRTVESGRLSISVVTPAKRLFPLKYQEIVTRSMDDVDDKAEWRVRKENSKVIPIALVVRVMAHEDRRNPGKTTNIYWAVAKISAGKACVTDNIREGERTIAEVRALADSAASRSCAIRLPMTAARIR